MATDFEFEADFGAPDVSYEIGVDPEEGTGVVNITFDDIEELTPFIRTIVEGNTIVAEAPVLYDGKTFNVWRIIYDDGTNDLVYDPVLSMEITEAIEIRAVYIVPMFREDVEYSPVGPLSPPLYSSLSSGSNNFINVEYEIV